MTIDFQHELNEEQYRVVTQGDGPCLVLAGAGSGKTRTIVYRVAYLLEQGVRPEEILLVTFTNKAAAEMRQRVSQVTRGAVDLPWSGTFHHIAFRLLRQYAPLLGYKSTFSILDSEDSVDLLKLCLKQEGVDRYARRFPAAKTVQHVISYARNASMSIESLIEEKYPEWQDIASVFVRIAADYDKRKRAAEAMDFDDLLFNMHLLLLQSQTVRDRCTKQFRYVMVDEYQDTNKLQAAIVRLFSAYHHNLLVVGDDAQSIYSFRAADIQNILSFETMYPNARIFRLETNYRSTPDILAVANHVIAKNVEQYQKALRSVKPAYTRPEIHPFTDQQEEAVFIAKRMLELRDEGVPLSRMAVLFRAAFHSQALEVELVKRDIPYEYRGGVRFFERAHIKDVLAYVRVFVNPYDTIAWSRVLTMQTGIGPATVEMIMSAIYHEVTETTIIQEAEDVLRTDSSDLSEPAVVALPLRDIYVSLLDALPPRAQKGWRDFLSIWQRMADAPSQTTTDMIRAVLQSSYADYLQAEYPDYRDRVQDIEQLALFAQSQPDMAKFLGEVTLQESFTGPKTAAGDDESEKVVLSTIHQAKGLEWEVVFVIGVAEGQFPLERSKKSGEIEEERRLFYVAITRAERLLYVTYPLLGGFHTALGGPSMFVNDIAHDLVEHHQFRPVGSTLFRDPEIILSEEDGVSYVAEDDGWGTQPKPPKRKSFLIDV